MIYMVGGKQQEMLVGDEDMTVLDGGRRRKGSGRTGEGGGNFRHLFKLLGRMPVTNKRWTDDEEQVRRNGQSVWLLKALLAAAFMQVRECLATKMATSFFFFAQSGSHAN